MRIGAGLLLIAVGAILRFGISTVSTHGIAIHTIGDILMLVGILGVVLWMLVWSLGLWWGPGEAGPPARHPAGSPGSRARSGSPAGPPGPAGSRPTVRSGS